MYPFQLEGVILFYFRREFVILLECQLGFHVTFYTDAFKIFAFRFKIEGDVLNEIVKFKIQVE